MGSNSRGGARCPMRSRSGWAMGSGAALGLVLVGTARAETVTLQALANGQLVEAVPFGPVVALGNHVTPLGSFDRLYLGNGAFVLQNRLSRLCLTVNPQNGLLTATALQDGDANEQFQAVAGQQAGSVALQSRANGRYLAVNTVTLGLQFGVLAATANSVSSDSSFVVAAIDPEQAVTAQPDIQHARQRIVGFGGALVFNEARLVANPYRSEIYSALFDPKQGLGITALRIGNNYGISETDAGGYADYNPDLVSGASTALGRPVTLIMSGWGPPAYLKNNNSTTAGTLRKVDGQYDYAGYAKWWADSITYWRSQNINPDFVSIQNEPEVVVSYVSNHFNPQEDVPYGDGTYGAPAAAAYGKALAAVHDAFAALPQPPALLGPEVDGTAHAKVEDYLAYSNPNDIIAIAHHLYDTADADDPDSFNPTLQGVADSFPNKPKVVTEWFSNDPPIVEAKAIHDVLVTEGSNAYVKWSLANSATVASAIYDDDATKPSSTWLYPHGWHINDNYYVMKHYSFFVRPGFQRVDAYASDANLRLSAFVDPDIQDQGNRRGTVVVLNTSSTETIPVVVSSPVAAVRSSAVYRTSFSGTERWASLGAWHAGAPIALPPNSAVTVAFNAN